MKTSEDHYYSVFFSSVDVANLKLNQNFILTTAKKKKITILKLFCILQVHVVQVAIIVIVIMIMMMMMTTLTMTMTIIDYYYYYLLLPQQR